MAGVPEFGDRVDGATYTARPGAYAVILDSESRIGLVRTHAGGYFLPGGGLQHGERPEEALAREVIEECGWTIQILSRIGQAVQCLFAEGEGYFAIEATFFRARLDRQVADPNQCEHELVWRSVADAGTCLRRGSDVWAVTQACGSKP